jgi:hypothetical protein
MESSRAMPLGSFFFTSGDCIESVLDTYKMSSLRNVCKMVNGFENSGQRSRADLYRSISEQTAAVQTEFRHQVQFLLGGMPSESCLVRSPKRKVEKTGDVNTLPKK